MRFKGFAAALLIMTAVSGAYANEITDFSVNGDGILSVTGSTEKNENVNLFVSKAEDSGVSGIVAVKQGRSENGSYTFSVNLEEALGSGGKFRFRTASQTEETAGGEFEYYTKSERRETLNRINAAAGEDEIKAVIEEKLDMMSYACPEFKTLAESGKTPQLAQLLGAENITEENFLSVINKTAAIAAVGNSKSAAEIKSIFEKYEKDMKLSEAALYSGINDKEALFAELAKNVNEYKTAAEFYADTDRAAVLADINSARGTDGMYAALTKYADKFDMTVYNRSDNDKTAMLRKLLTAAENGGFASISEVQALLDVKIQKESDGSSGGGGGGSKTPSGSYSAPPAAPPEYDETDKVIPETVFTDLTGYDWAKIEIEKLAELKIIGGTDKNIFAPSKNVTRAEIAKMICGLMNIVQENGDAGFADVRESDWFAGYVKALTDKKIIFGISETEFKPNDYISRQDLAVMLQRALGIEAAPEETAFADAEEIADYAAEAAAALKSAGIIKGDAAGKFNPAGKANRAEAAVMIYRSLLSKGGAE